MFSARCQPVLKTNTPFNKRHMLKYLVLFLPCLNGLSAKAQDYMLYYDKINKAEYAYEIKKQPAEAIKLMKQAKRIAPLKIAALETCAYCYLELGDTLAAIDNIREAVIDKNFELIHIKKFYPGLAASHYFVRIEKDYPKWVQEYFCNKNVALIVELTKMSSYDQCIRWNHEAFKEADGDLVFHKVDSSNIFRLKELYEQYGYLDYPNMFILFWHNLHNYPAMWAYFEPIMYKAIYTGKFYPQSYAQMYDRYRVYHEGKNSWYGEFSEEGFGKEFGEIDEVAGVDIRRKAIGLCSIKERAERAHWKLPPGYKPQ
jgi:tetratricopeptide (TPR) repeat protein